MKRTGVRVLLGLVVGIVVLAIVGIVAYNFGWHASQGDAGPMFGPFHARPFGMGYGYGFGFQPFGLLMAVIVGFVLVWLVVALLSGPGRGTPRTPADQNGVDRLRELTELHDRGALTDDEFAAAKRQLLGL